MKAHLEKYHPDLNKEFLMLVTKANLDKVKFQSGAERGTGKE
jgi:hypothetical protein